MSQTVTQRPAESRPAGDGAVRTTRRGLRGRPQLYTSYERDQAPLGTPARRFWVAALIIFLVLAPLQMNFEFEALMTRAFVSAIGALGLNLLTGYAGQVSLGHAFFLGVGAYTGAVFGAASARGVIGFDLDMWIWLPLAGIVPALLGMLVAPVALRLRGLYLAIVTLGLVFIGEHLFKEMRFITGGPGTGRNAASPTMFGYDFTDPVTIGGTTIDGSTMFYLLCLGLLIVFAVVAKNVARSKVGRSFAAVRDRDIAAEIMGVDLTRAKVTAFTISSFYAGVCGALLAIANGGRLETTEYNLLLSVDFLAIILIGGVATVSGSLLGALFLLLVPRLVQELPRFLPFIEPGSAQVGFLNVFQTQTLLFGVFIVVFLQVEPRGLYGIWLRVRNYWKAFPFSY
jgi:branched-chain amino acid transport system permease protein